MSRGAVRRSLLGWLAVAAVGCGTDGGDRLIIAADVVVHEQANGTTVTLKIGQTLAVELRALGDSGYTGWVLSATPNAAVLRLVRSTHVPPAEPRPGDFGEDVFLFQAMGTGQTRLVTSATQPWAGGDTQTFTLDVSVGVP